MAESRFRIACEGVPYRKGFIEVALIRSGLVNLETWEISAEWTAALPDLSELPDEALMANTELELTISQARELAAALLRAADAAGAAEPTA